MVVLGEEPLKGRFPRTSIARVRLWGESQVYGPSLSPADVLNDQEWGVACAGRPECMKSPPSLRSHRTRARNGKTLGMARQPFCTNVHSMCCASSEATPCSSTAAAPGLSQWSLVEASFVTAATTSCLLASAWVSSAG